MNLAEKDKYIAEYLMTLQADTLRNMVADFYSEAKNRIAEFSKYKERAYAEIEELKSRKFARFSDDECWIYQGDGNDNLETLVCPVVIRPDVLKRIIDMAEPDH